MGIGLGFGAGPLRVYVPLTGGGGRRRKRTKYWTHKNCPTRHKSLEAAQACYERHEAAYQRRQAAARKRLAAAQAQPPRAVQAAAPAPAGWYPLAGRPGAQRYWDGNAWTDHVHDPNDSAPDLTVGRSADPGWYPVAAEPGTLRWWDGTAWTEHRHPAQ